MALVDLAPFSPPSLFAVLLVLEEKPSVTLGLCQRPPPQGLSPRLPRGQPVTWDSHGRPPGVWGLRMLLAWARGLGMNLKPGPQRAPVCLWQTRAIYDAVCWGSREDGLECSRYGLLAGWGWNPKSQLTDIFLVTDSTRPSLLRPGWVCVPAQTRLLTATNIGLRHRVCQVPMVTNSHDLTTEWALPIPILQLRKLDSERLSHLGKTPQLIMGGAGIQSYVFIHSFI